MLFNSIDFAVFLPLVFVIYWTLAKTGLKIQNAFLVIASYVFYGWWDWRFLSLIIFSSIVDYFVGLYLKDADGGKSRKLALLLSLTINLGLLGFFKYYNFFLESFVDAFSLFGQSIEASRLNIILPVGISFYTFQTLSYSIDVYRRKLEPTHNFIQFAAYVSFFPQLVAGPIERATSLLPQFQKKRHFDYSKAVDGMRQMLWGFFKKLVIADNCALYVNRIFEGYEGYDGSTLLLGGILFAFQIYCDFSGYSDIAIGTARLFGFDLRRNFAFPYFSRDIAEFWRRWHISLSTWFRDYLYIPLGGSRGSARIKIRNVFVIFVISGFWHGANWTFVFWGLLNALYFIPMLLLGRNRQNLGTVAEGSILPSIREIIQMGLTFFLTIVAWIFFRAENLGMAFDYLRGMFTRSLISMPQVTANMTIGMIGFMVLVEWIQRHQQHGLEIGISVPNRWVRWSIYLIITLMIFSFGSFEKTEFIYFAF